MRTIDIVALILAGLALIGLSWVVVCLVCRNRWEDDFQRDKVEIRARIAAEEKGIIVIPLPDNLTQADFERIRHLVPSGPPAPFPNPNEERLIHTLRRLRREADMYQATVRPFKHSDTEDSERIYRRHKELQDNLLEALEEAHDVLNS